MLFCLPDADCNIYSLWLVMSSMLYGADCLPNVLYSLRMMRLLSSVNPELVADCLRLSSEVDAVSVFQTDNGDTLS